MYQATYRNGTDGYLVTIVRPSWASVVEAVDSPCRPVNIVSGGTDKMGRQWFIARDSRGRSVAKIIKL